MARPKKINDEILVRIVNEYYAEVAYGDFEKVRFKSLEAYSIAQGIDVKEHVFRRNEAVRRRMEELKEMASSDVNADSIASYQSLDIESLVKSCGSIDELKHKLAEMDAYWRSIYEKQVVETNKTRSEMMKAVRMQKKMEVLENEAATLRVALFDTQNELKSMKKENSYLKGTLKKYVYPELAMELMRQGNLPVEAERKNLQPEAYETLIEPKRPVAFTGRQGEAKKRMTREEKLLDQLRKQVKE